MASRLIISVDASAMFGNDLAKSRRYRSSFLSRISSLSCSMSLFEIVSYHALCLPIIAWREGHKTLF